MTTPALNKRLTKAKLTLMRNIKTVFFAEVMLRMKHVWDEKIPTAATDGLSCYYNPSFFEEIAEDEGPGLVLHEVCHPALGHMTRRGNRDPYKWNIACDYAENLIILDSGIKLPAGALLDKKYRGMSAEQIYDALPEDPEPPPMQDMLAPGDLDQLADKLDDILVEAAIATQKHSDEAWGHVPGNIKRHIEKLLNPTVPWKRVFVPFMNQLHRQELTYQRINRRYAPDWIFPTPNGERLESGSVFIDVSGSVNNQQFMSWAGEAWYVIKRFHPKELYLGQFDHGIHVDKLTCEKDFNKVEFHGGGGTNITPVLEWAQQNRPNWLVIFTDGYFDRPKIKLNIPTVWIVHSNPNWKVPFGKKITYELPEQKH